MEEGNVRFVTDTIWLAFISSVEEATSKPSYKLPRTQIRQTTWYLPFRYSHAKNTKNKLAWTFIIIFNVYYHFLLCKALWIATEYEMCYINKLALPQFI